MTKVIMIPMFFLADPSKIRIESKRCRAVKASLSLNEVGKTGIVTQPEILGLQWRGWEEHEFEVHSKIQASLTLLQSNTEQCLKDVLSMRESLESMVSAFLTQNAGSCPKPKHLQGTSRRSKSSSSSSMTRNLYLDISAIQISHLPKYTHSRS